MKIAGSNVSMYAARQAWQMGRKGSPMVEGASSFQNIASRVSGTKYDTYVPTDGKNGFLMGNPYDENGVGVSEVDATKQSTDVGQASPMQQDLLSLVWQRLMQAMGIFSGGSGTSQMNVMGAYSYGASAMYVQQVATYEEYEATSFHADGKAMTEDGRCIEFNVDISMSRSYREYMCVETPLFQNLLMDPLVVNVGSDTTQISDQTFRFDLDCDGEEEEINQLGRGSGFLALDQNGDGKINDGSELFGTKSGDGFGDLRAYDSDGNGWIDENDAIFDKLRIWCKGENGEDILMSLKEADVGAIYLGEKQTQFSMQNPDGTLGGRIQSSGVFLRESGSASTIQHVDLAIQQAIEAIEDVMEALPTEQTIVDNESKTPKQSSSNRSVIEAKNEEAARRQAEEEHQARVQAEKENREARIARRKAMQKELSEAAQKRREEYKEMSEANIERHMERQRRLSNEMRQEQLERVYGIG